jgi:hypothetical protein
MDDKIKYILYMFLENDYCAIIKFGLSHKQGSYLIICIKRVETCIPIHIFIVVLNINFWPKKFQNMQK